MRVGNAFIRDRTGKAGPRHSPLNIQGAATVKKGGKYSVEIPATPKKNK
jgi:hypothetical protein